ncbi:MAG: zinc ribbon domain-containing protein [Planctomycetota bacterium]
MPLYEYLCRECDREVELLVRGGDESPSCPECGSEKLMKLLSVPSAPGSALGGDEPPGPCGSACGCFPPG